MFKIKIVSNIIKTFSDSNSGGTFIPSRSVNKRISQYS